jgi:hypothetical protein
MTPEARRSQVESLNFSRHRPQFAQVCCSLAYLSGPPALPVSSINGYYGCYENHNRA